MNILKELSNSPAGRSIITAIESFGETVYDISLTLGALLASPSYTDPWKDDSRARYQDVAAWAWEFEQAHQLEFGLESYTGTTDETGDDYILAIDAFTERKLKEKREGRG